MSRLIDADSLLLALDKRKTYELADGRNRAYGKGVRDAMKDVDKQPTIDAVPVVRCKDCKYAYMTDDGYCNWCDIMADLLGLEYDDIHLPGDWFCADGKKVTE